MPAGQRNNLSRQIRRLALVGYGGVTDTQLLDLFVSRKDDAAFEAIVKRYGLMVLAVCRRVLRDPHDTQDAFQATFLVLVRKAATLTKPELLGNWLYGVAYRAALKMKHAKARRQFKERQVCAMPPPEAAAVSDEVLAELDREISNLPDKYRAPLVYCDLQGLSRAEAAKKLDWPVGTLNWRLAAARAKVAKALKRRGLTLGAGGLAVLVQQSAAAALPPSLVALTVKAGMLVASGQAVAAGVISAQVAYLIEGVVKAMLLSKLKAPVAMLLLASVLGVGAGKVAQEVRASAGGDERQAVTRQTKQVVAKPQGGESDGEKKLNVNASKTCFFGEDRKPASVSFGEVSINGPKICISEKEKRIEVTGAGVMNMAGKEAIIGDRSAKTRSRLAFQWQKELSINGTEAVFYGPVQVYDEHGGGLKCQHLSLKLNHPLSFKDGGSENQDLEVDRLLCDRNVWLERWEHDANGNRRSLERIIVPQLDIDKREERLIAAGPGKIEQLTPVDVKEPILGKSAENTKRLTRIAFEGRVFSTSSVSDGNQTRVAKFYNNVEIYHFIAADADEKMDPENPRRGGFYIKSGILTLMTRQVDGQRRQFMEAQSDVLIRTPEFHGSATAVTYDESKETFTIQGAPGKPATLLSKSAGAAAPVEIKGGRILYNRKTGEFLTDGVKVVARASEPRSITGTFNETNFVNSRRINLPVNLQENRRNELSKLLLFASWDQGLSYLHVASASPDQKEFAFEADRDGLCWLRVAVVDRQGKQEPKDIMAGAPELKLFIDTKMPMVRTFTAERRGNLAILNWEIVEEHLDPQRFLLEYSTLGDSPPVWTPITAPPGPTGKTWFVLPTSDSYTFRLTARDKAGNQTFARSHIDATRGPNRQAGFEAALAAADQRFEAREYLEALRAYKTLQDQNRATVAGLIACHRIGRCFFATINGPEEVRLTAQEAMAKAKADLASMPEDSDAFRGSPRVWDKAQWQAWLRATETFLQSTSLPGSR